LALDKLDFPILLSGCGFKATFLISKTFSTEQKSIEQQKSKNPDQEDMLKTTKI